MSREEPPAIQPISSQHFFAGPTTSATIPARLPSVDGERSVNMMRCMGDMVIHCSIAFEGTIDAPRMARAMRLFMDQEPHLGSRLVHGWWQPYWVRRQDLDELTLLTLVETDDWEAALEAYMVEPFLPTEHPMLAARIFRSSDGHDTMCLRVNHVVADAGAVKQTMYNLASLYHTLRRDPAHQVTPNLQGSRSINQLLKHVGFTRFLRMVLRYIKDFKTRLIPLKRRTLGHEPTGPMKPAYVFRHLSEEEGVQLKHYARRNGVTVNDVVVAALGRGIFGHMDAPDGMQLRLTNTVDLRRYMPGRKAGAICNFSCFSFPAFGTYKRAEPFEATLERAAAEMRLLKESDLGTGEVPMMTIISQILPHSLASWIMRSSLKPARWFLPPAFTNMGKVDADALPFEDATPIHAWLTASVVYPPYFVGGISGFGNRLTLSSGFCANTTPREEIEGLLDSIVEHITQGVQGAQASQAT